MNRLIHILVVVSLLASQSAWAFQDIELYAQPEQVESQKIDQHNQEAEACDHYCHANGHLVGFFYNKNFTQFTAITSKIATVNDLTSLISYQPPTPPPNS